MAATTTIPVTITPEAQARIEELGRQAEFAKMIEHVRVTIPGLVAIEVEQYFRYDESSPPGVCLKVWTSRPWKEVGQLQDSMSTWLVTTFPPEHCEHCCIDVSSTQRKYAS